jgi:HD-GYP domain-containing protein (c-di-GMP phosphodiesterase class II)
MSTGTVQVQEKDLLLSGGFGRSSNSARAGFLPVALDRVPLGALEGVQVYVRVRSDASNDWASGMPAHGAFRLYCAENVRFADVHRRRLIEHGVRFIYIRMSDQSRFRRQTETHLDTTARDPAVAITEKSALIYETSVELVNELLAEPEMIHKSPRLESVSRAVTTLVMNNPKSFTHLFAASHHDFYTATHMVNVGTWMVPLAYELGHRDPDELNRICQAGLLHDMGKIFVSEEVLNKPGKLSEEDWRQIRSHPEKGVEYLSQFEGVDPMILRVTLQHHERVDGSGYPKGIKGDQMDPISKICAVVDSFDAMTAFRPFKERTLSVQESLAILKKETPSKYDPVVMEAWLKLIHTAQESGGVPVAEQPEPVAAVDRPADASNRRQHSRQAFHCPARAHSLVRTAAGLEERGAIPIVAHSISRGGIGFLSQVPIPPGEYLRVYLQAKGWDKRALEGLTVRCRGYDDCWSEVGLQFTAMEKEAVPESKAA